MSEGHLSEKFGLEYTDAAKTIAGLRADKWALVAEVERLRESNKELVAALKLTRYYLAHFEKCEASADDGLGPQLRRFRQELAMVDAALAKAEAGT